MCEKPLISEESDLLDGRLLNELLAHVCTLSSVFHKLPASFVQGRVPGKRQPLGKVVEDEEEQQETPDLGGASAAPAVDLLGSLDSGPSPTSDLADLAGLGGLGGSSVSVDRKSTRLNSSHRCTSRMPSSA